MHLHAWSLTSITRLYYGMLAWCGRTLSIQEVYDDRQGNCSWQWGYSWLWPNLSSLCTIPTHLFLQLALATIQTPKVDPAAKCMYITVSSHNCCLPTRTRGTVEDPKNACRFPSCAHQGHIVFNAVDLSGLSWRDITHLWTHAITCSHIWHPAPLGPGIQYIPACPQLQAKVLLYWSHFIKSGRGDFFFKCPNTYANLQG